MKTAVYYTDTEPKVQLLWVKTENADKTVNLVDADRDDAAIVIGKCPVSTDGKVGTCVVGPHPKPEAESKEPKEKK